MSDPRSKWCRHYDGIFTEQCKVGILADTLPRPRPCVNLDNERSPWGQCPHFAEYTSAELDEQDRQSETAVRAYLDALASDKCPHCGAGIAKREQVGRCVYASPCGHRLYQGTVGKRVFA